jgi:hypothetical protein
MAWGIGRIQRRTLVRSLLCRVDWPCEALRRIGELYRIEEEIRGRPHEERRVARQEKSRPITDRLVPWLREQLGYISQKTKLAEAIRYALSRWDGLTRFIDDGGSRSIPTSSNAQSGQLPSIARMLFAGSEAGAEHWATIASLIETAKLNNVEPLAYLSDVSPRSSTIIQIARSTTCCLGPMPQRTMSKPWPENSAYVSVARYADSTCR